MFFFFFFLETLICTFHNIHTTLPTGESPAVCDPVTIPTQPDVSMDIEGEGKDLFTNNTAENAEVITCSDISDEQAVTGAEAKTMGECKMTDSDMYNPLEPTSYVEQSNMHLDSNRDHSVRKKDSYSNTHQSVNKFEENYNNESPCVGSHFTDSSDCVASKSTDLTRAAVDSDEQSIMEKTQQTVDELKNRNVAPIISLHYSNEGTSYSNIRLRFATLEPDGQIRENDRASSQGSQSERGERVGGSRITEVSCF